MRTHLMTHSLGAALILAALSTGCARIHNEKRDEDRLISSQRTVEQDKVALVQAVADLGPGKDGKGAALRVQAFSARTCTTVETRTLDRTEVIARENESPRLTFWSHAAGGLGAALLLAAATAPDPLRENARLTPAGGVAIAGIALLPFLLGGVVDDVRASDSRRHLGQVQERIALDKKLCAEEPLPDAHIEVTATAALADVAPDSIAATADAQGRAEINAEALRTAFFHGVLPPGAPVPQLELRVEGRLAGKSDALRPLLLAWTEDEAAKQRAQEAELRRAVLTEELVTGHCEAQRAEEMERTLARVFEKLKAPESGEGFSLIRHQLLVATGDGTNVTLEALAGGALHLFAIGFDPVKLEVRDLHGNEAGLEDPLERTLGEAGPTASRVVEVNADEKLSVKVSGTGCTLVVTARRY